MCFEEGWSASKSGPDVSGSSMQSQLPAKTLFETRFYSLLYVLMCTPIFLRLLHHRIWDPWRAFGHILKECCAFPSPSQQRPTASILLPGPDLIWHFKTLFEARLYSSCMLWCTPILLSLLQHCIWDPWRAFGNDWRNGGHFPPFTVHSDQLPTAPIWLWLWLPLCPLYWGPDIWHFDPH